ncbi:CGNR zinc finger domain-containing protein [bacterium]|nr:CGNR zinc finger domain-containing protein [bacterium]
MRAHAHLEPRGAPLRGVTRDRAREDLTRHTALRGRAAAARYDAFVEWPGAPPLVRRCANPDWLLFFYDASKTHRRRWCDMRVCGNLMKVRAFHRCQRQARVAPERLPK